MQTHIPIEGSAWELALLETSDGNRLIAGTYEGDVLCVDPDSGAALWRVEGEDFPFGLEIVSSSTPDDKLILLATAGGDLVAIDPLGQVRWTFHSRFPMQAAAGVELPDGTTAIACGGIEDRLYLLDADGKVLLERQMNRFVHRLLGGDFDGDGLDELLVMDSRGGAIMLKPSWEALDVLWEHPIQLPPEYANWENWSGQHQPMDLAAADIDGDGVDEIILGDSFHNHQTVAVLSGNGELRWASTPLDWYARDKAWFEYFSTAWVTTIPSRDHPSKRDIATVAGGLVRVFSREGELLGQAESVLGFADVVADGRTLYLGSTPNGDETIYRLDLSQDWQETLVNLEPEGKALRIRQTLTEIHEQVHQNDGQVPPRAPFLIEQYRLGHDQLNPESYRKTLDLFAEQVPEPAFRNVIPVRVLEDKPVCKADGTAFNQIRFDIDSPMGTQTPDEIVQLVERIEEAGIPATFEIGHNCNPKVSLDTARRMLEAGPGTLMGFSTAEDVSAETIGDYVKQFLAPLCDLCLRYGRKTVTIKNKVLWWLDGPAMKVVYDNLFGTQRREVLVANTEESVSRWAETNLMGRLGLYYAGRVREMKVGVIRDMFAPNNFHQCEYPRSGHPFLRMLIAHAAAGNSIFRFAISDKITHGPGKDRYNLLGRESTELFLHLLGKGLVFPPTPAEMANISPVGLVMHPPPEKWLKNAHNNHRAWEAQEDEETLEGIYSRLHCGWGHAPLPEFAFSRVAFEKKRVFDCQVPATPYGHILMLPCHFQNDSIEAVERWWHTDGIYLWSPGGSKMKGPEAGRALRDSLEQAKKSLPVQSTGQGVYYQVIRMQEDRYRLIAVDPGWLDPADRRAAFEINMDGNWQARDLLGGKALPIEQGRLELPVPAGAFRIVDLMHS